MTSNSGTQAATVCEPCKRRKKKCDKKLLSCSRCSRLSIKCSYSVPTETFTALPALTNVVPEFAARSNDSAISGLQGSPARSRYEWPGFDDLAAVGLRSVLDAVSRSGLEDVYSKNYFKNFHKSLPIIDKDAFYWQLENSPSECHFSLLLLAMFLVAQLSSKEAGALEKAKEIYPTLKGAHSLFQSSEKVSVELVQAGLLIASFEHCQALHREAWLTVGACARVGHIIRQQILTQKPGPKMRGLKIVDDYKCSVWWGIVILERIINAEFMDNKLPLSTEPPNPDDLLPVISLDDRIGSRVADDLLLPEQIETTGELKLKNRGFTKLSVYSTIIQSTYLSSLVTRHVLDRSKGSDTREAEAARLDTALQSFGSSLIPPPGQANGDYCGAYAIRTSAAFYLYQNQLDVALESGRVEEATRARIALQSLTRIIIHATKAARIGRPLDLDVMAFWSHRIVHTAAVCHIRFGERDQDWKSDLQVLKSYLKYFEPRYKIYSNCLHEIEIAERAFCP